MSTYYNDACFTVAETLFSWEVLGPLLIDIVIKPLNALLSAGAANGRRASRLASVQFEIAAS
jgi:hypothetical protein